MLGLKLIHLMKSVQTSTRLLVAVYKFTVDNWTLRAYHDVKLTIKQRNWNQEGKFSIST